MNCINHNVAASTACANCGAPICGSCTLIARGHNVCPTCAPEVRQRGLTPTVSAMPMSTAPVTAAAPAASPYPDFSGGQSNPSTPMPSNPTPAQPFGATAAPPQYAIHDTSDAALAKARREDKMRLMIGIACGSVVGLLGSIGIIEIIFFTHMGFPYLYIILGYGIGAGVWYVTNRGGVQLAMASAGIFIGSQIVSHLIFTAQYLAKARADGNADPGTTFIDALPDAMAAFTGFHWGLIVIGLMACCYAAQRAPR